MSKQIQLRRGTTAQHSTFTGAEGECTVDTTKDTVVVHDGATVGGYPLSKEPSSQTLSGYTIASSAALPASSDTINQAIGKLAKQLTANGILKSNGTVVSAATAGSDYLNTSDIIDTLVSTSTTDALSANMGKSLQDTKSALPTTQTLIGYTRAASVSDVTISDTINTGIGKLEKKIEDVNIDQSVYGVIWDKSSTPTLTRSSAMSGATVTVGTDSTPSAVSTVTVSGTEILTYNKYIKDTLFDWKEVTDTYGNVFVKIPKIYLKKVDGVGNKEWYASRVSFDGCYLPKCFYDFTNSRELDYVLVGKYPASLSSDTTKLESKPNTFPLSGKNIVQFRDLAKANNTGGLLGYQQLDIHVVDLLQTLFIIQNATLYSQSKCAGFSSGRYTDADVATATESSANRIIVANDVAAKYEVGQTIGIGTSLGGNQIIYNRLITSIDVHDASNKAISFDGAAVTITTGNILYNLPNKNGFSSSIVSRFGSKASTSSGKHGFVWNGIENLYGNMFQFVDGLNVNNNQAWVCNDANSYVSNTFASPYEQLSYVCANTSNYIQEMGYDSSHPFAMLPTVVNSSLTATYYTDYYSQNSGQRIARFGGSWTTGASGGWFYWRLDYSSSDAAVAIGARLLKKPL